MKNGYKNDIPLVSISDKSKFITNLNYQINHWPIHNNSHYLRSLSRYPIYRLYYCNILVIYRFNKGYNIYARLPPSSITQNLISKTVHLSIYVMT